MIVTSENFSYAMLMLSDPDALRNNEWDATTNSLAPILSDRNLGGNNTADHPSNPASIHDANRWRGSVAYNDNHVEFEGTNLLRTQYQGGRVLVDDDLFTTGDGRTNGAADSATSTLSTGDDAAMVFHDDNSLTNQE